MRTLKKSLALFMAVAMTFTMLVGINLTVSAENEGIYEYSVIDDKAVITTCDTSAAGEITVPDTLGGYPVTMLEAFAFQYCTEITDVTIPAGITYISEGIFDYCEKLKSLKVASGNTVYHSKGNCIIETATGTLVAGCKNSVIPTDSSVTSIGNSAFYGCKKLESITIPKNITSIGNTAFAFCSALKNVVFEEGVSSIGISAFDSCYELSTVTIPKSLTFVADQAFYGCGISVNVYYTGSQSQWEKIIFEEANDCVRYGNVQYNYDPNPATTYTITYKLNGGTNAKSNPETFTIASADILLNSPTRKGYYFVAWYADKDFTTAVSEIPTGSIGNRTLYARWTAVTYNITYMLKGGKNNDKNPKSYKITSSDITLKKPTKKGYTFDGWYNNSSKKVTVIKKGSTGSITLTANWKATKYTITYKLNKGTNNSKNPKSYKITTSAITLKAPTRKGYKFGGWYSDSKLTKKVTKIEKGSTGNKTLYAKWTAIDYKITYKLNKGKNSSKNPKSYKITSSTITLKAPTRKGYKFKGWYSDSKFKKKVTKIAKGSTGNKTLYAKW